MLTEAIVFQYFPNFLTPPVGEMHFEIVYSIPFEEVYFIVRYCKFITMLKHMTPWYCGYMFYCENRDGLKVFSPVSDSAPGGITYDDWNDGMQVLGFDTNHFGMNNYDLSACVNALLNMYLRLIGERTFDD